MEREPVTPARGERVPQESAFIAALQSSLKLRAKSPNGSLGQPQSASSPNSSQVSGETSGKTVKELIDKLAWAVGSTLHLPYAGKRTPLQAWAYRLSMEIVKRYDQGFRP